MNLTPQTREKSLAAAWTSWASQVALLSRHSDAKALQDLFAMTCLVTLHNLAEVGLQYGPRSGVRQ